MWIGHRDTIHRHTVRPNTMYAIDQVLRMIALLVTTTHSTPLCARAFKHKIAAGQPTYLVDSDLYQVLLLRGTWILLAVASWGGSLKSTPGS